MSGCLINIFPSGDRMNFIKSSVVLTLFCLFFTSYGSVVINEIVSSNGSCLADEDGDYEDWLELYNSSTEAVQLEGFKISDNPADPGKWTFPELLLQPGAYLVVFASGKDRTNGEYLHTGFNISADGEPLILTNAAGDTVDLVEAIPIPRDVSYGRTADAPETFAFFSTPTPGTANSSVVADSMLPPPIFSHRSGFYAENISLTLSCADPAAQIYYTLDGSEPDPQNTGGSTYRHKVMYQTPDSEFLERSFVTLHYTAPIPITERSADEQPMSAITTTFDTAHYQPPDPVFRGVTVRAVAVKEGALPSKIATCTYLVDTVNAHRYPVPVVSIAVPETSFFKYESGIYVPGQIFDDSLGGSTRYQEIGFANPPSNYTQRGDAWEREVNFELLDVNGNELLNQVVGVRIHGGYTRAVANKSLRVYARNRYGDNTLSHRLFASKEIDKFKTILLRNSGNDHNVTLFRDALIQRLVASLAIDQQASTPVVVFMNGEYWGVANIRDRLDKYYLETHYDLDADSIDMLSVNMMNRGYEVNEGEGTHYDALMEYVTTQDVTDPEVYEKVNTMMDVENFILYQTIQIYSRNTDWPHNNVDWWRARTATYQPDAPYGHDGRWRWMLYDLDFGFGIWDNTAEHNTLEYATCTTGRTCMTWATGLFSTLLKNNDFRTATINRFADLMNSVFHADTVVAKIEEMRKIYAPLVAEHNNRWGGLKSVSRWETCVDSMELFATTRKGYMVEHISDFFNLEDTVQVTLAVASQGGGTVKVNTVTAPAPTWTGMYFAGVPLTIEAIAAPGFRFTHWTGGASDSTAQLTIVPAADPAFTAHFIEDASSVTPPLLRPKPQMLHSVALFNCKGQRVAVFPEVFKAKGTLLATISNRALPAGIYFLKMMRGKTPVIERVTVSGK